MGIWIENKWYEEPELSAYIKQLKEVISDLDRTISDLQDKHWNECRQIAHYEEELTEAKRLLKIAVESFDKLLDTVVGFEQRCIVCDYAMKYANPYDACNSCPLGNGKHKRCTWKFKEEAMKLIGVREDYEED